MWAVDCWFAFERHALRGGLLSLRLVNPGNNGKAFPPGSASSPPPQLCPPPKSKHQKIRDIASTYINSSRILKKSSMNLTTPDMNGEGKWPCKLTHEHRC